MDTPIAPIESQYEQRFLSRTICTLPINGKRCGQLTYKTHIIFLHIFFLKLLVLLQSLPLFHDHPLGLQITQRHPHSHTLHLGFVIFRQFRTPHTLKCLQIKVLLLVRTINTFQLRRQKGRSVITHNMLKLRMFVQEFDLFFLYLAGRGVIANNKSIGVKVDHE